MTFTCIGGCVGLESVFSICKEYHFDVCGIYGAGSPLEISQETLAKIDVLGQKLQHRGPDDNSQISDTHYLLGFNRLAIVDVEHGMQPFYSRRDDIVVTANGQIYNYLELREELVEAGCELRTKCDIEVIPHLYEIYGDDFVKKLRGMFAISILDKRSSKLKLFVDRLGEKPLYWSMQNGTLFYSSEVTPILESKIASMSLDSQQISSYLKFGFVPDPYTMIKEVFRISGGTFLVYSINHGSLVQEKYWSSDDKFESLKNPISTLRTCLQNIGETIFQGEVKMGVALSGGVDSKFVAKLAKSTGTHVEAITIGYDVKSRHDEAASAVIASQELAMNHHVELVKLDNIAQTFRQACSLLDEPVADIACINYLTLFNAAKDLGIKVLLMGHGVDELVMSYKWLNVAIRRATLRSSTLSGNFQILQYLKILEKPDLRLTEINLLNLIRGVQENLFTLKQIVIDYQDFKSGVEVIDFYELSPHTKQKSVYGKKMETMNSQMSPLGTFGLGKSKNEYWRLARSQLLSGYLRNNGFLQLDKLSMAKSIEVRNPFVDYTFAETILKSHWRFPTLPAKSLVKAGFDLSMPEVQKTDIKRGFSPPTRTWYKKLLNEFSKELENPRSIELGLFPLKWKRLFIRPFRWNKAKSPIWFELLMMEIWVRETEKRVGLTFTSSINIESSN